jgi:hypothetical protein
LAGYEMVNAWELEEERRRLCALTVEEAARQHFETWEMARCVSPEAEESSIEERMAHYEALHRKLEKVVEVMGCADWD